ncbi:hypothetical protein [Devosia sp. 2618]|uniref:hypothetical protein n=1 Tax=Devosia sp. 2618 TaxID=3156454 RepID=UPI00339AA28C
MAKSTATFFDELMAATRGCIALLVGNRQAPSYFDFSQRGLIGSLIATVIAVGLAGFGPLLAGVPLPPGSATQSIIVNGVLFVAQAATAYLALRQMGRHDGFIPYLVASNWVTLASAVLLTLSTFLGPLGILILVLVVILALATFVNIGRFIVTLTPLQIGILFVSQAVGVFFALAIVAVLIGPPVPAV